MAIKAAILGASGFAGGELLRLLEAHPAIEVVAAGASSQAGKQIADVFPMLGYSGMAFQSIDEAMSADADVLFSSLPHGQSMNLLAGARTGAVIDLAGDFRLKDPELYLQWYGQTHPAPEALDQWVYGLTEFHRQEISFPGQLGSGGPGGRAASGKRIANPGCYAAACILALGPLLEAGLVRPDQIQISAMSGVSGAGRAQGQGFDFVSANENTRPYKPTGHNHIAEIEQELSHLSGRPATVSFVPHLVPMNRGILVTAAAAMSASATEEDLQAALNERYQNEPFVHVLGLQALPETKRVSGTNFAEVAVRADRRTGRALSFAAIDNLGKGAAGQALQNANLMLGLDETAGLTAPALIP